MTLSLEKRKELLNLIKLDLEQTFEQNLISATVYGSTLWDDFNAQSDFDILLVFNKITIDNLFSLKKIKVDFRKYGITIDFNVHTCNEIPKIRGKAFWLRCGPYSYDAPIRGLSIH